MPHWPATVAKTLPLTYVLALFRRPQALHVIWVMSNTAMALLSLPVLVPMLS